MKLSWRSKPTRVYVDAKVLNMHVPGLAREAFVGYIVEGNGRHNVRRVDASESDDAEVLAILYAIEDLKESLDRFVVVCDHESVVSEAVRDDVRKPSLLMLRLRQVLKENPSIGLEPLMANPAHGIVTEYVNSLKAPAG